MAGHLAHRVVSVQGAKHVFKLEVDRIAKFACVAGLVNGRTGPFEMEELKFELNHCLRPLCMTEELRRFATAPTPPPAVPSTPPPGLFSPLSTPPPRPAFQYRWSLGRIPPARADLGGVGTGGASGLVVTPVGPPVPTGQDTSCSRTHSRDR